MPEIRLLRSVEGEQADRLKACFSDGVIDVLQDAKSGNGKFHLILRIAASYFSNLFKIYVGEGRMEYSIEVYRFLCSIFDHNFK